MKWLIVEDALKNKQGHWYEYIETFRSGLSELGHDTKILSEHAAETFITDAEDVYPVLPDSIWHRMGDSASRWKRYLRVPQHAWKTRRVIKRWLRQNDHPDLVFVPTVLVHHLLGWWRIYQDILRHSDTRLLLFFPNTPIRFNSETNSAEFGNDPTSKLFLWLIKRLERAVRSGQVILGVETHAMRDGMSQVTGVPFTYLPHPVRADDARAANEEQRPLTFGCYGAARHEKGSDLLQDAVREHLRENPNSDSRFYIQWLDSFEDASGNVFNVDEELAEDHRVNFIRSFFEPGGYEKQLAITDVMLLPYRDPYRYRVSRVVIEAMNAGMPAVVSNDTTAWEQVSEFGAGLPCSTESPMSLAAAIADVERNSKQLKQDAREKAEGARAHFSVRTFVNIIEKPPA